MLSGGRDTKNILSAKLLVVDDVGRVGYNLLLSPFQPFCMRTFVFSDLISTFVCYKNLMKSDMSEKNPANDQSNIIKKLRNRVEETFGGPVTTPNRFDALVQMIFERTGILLSPTTLKRMWGYLNEPVTPRASTLNTLARFCGWSDFEHFKSGENVAIESGAIGAPVVSAGKNIMRGERLRLFWAPSRMCLIEYKGDNHWLIIEAEGTRLTPGDTFDCAMIIWGEPLYLDNLSHGGQRPGAYVCGRRTGVTFVYHE